MALTLRNWLIGLYIKEYEQNGADRAKYASNTLQKLADELQSARILSTAYTSLKQYRQFYEIYPQISQALSGQFKAIKQEVPTLEPEKLVSLLSYSHFAELMKIDDQLKRSFYEIESVHSNWSSRELRRQISTLYYERLGLSKDKAKLAKMIDTKTYAHDIQDVIREPYVFEFAGVKYEEVNETTVANALLTQLNAFFLEMGRGFCFEASNKKILIGDQFYFIDFLRVTLLKITRFYPQVFLRRLVADLNSPLIPVEKRLISHKFLGENPWPNNRCWDGALILIKSDI